MSPPTASPASATPAAPIGTEWDCGLHRPRDEVHDSEHRVRWVVVLTVVTMVAELIVGAYSGSLALVADGWHMASHAGALGLSSFAYWLARTRATNRAFVFGTGKVYALAGYTNAVALALVALIMVIEGVARLYTPVSIGYGEALPVAVVGLLVNLASVKLLKGGPTGHGHAPDQVHDHDHAHDHNLKAAYFHVLADALTSVLAIAGLIAGMYFGWNFLDPAIAILGGAVIMHWSVGLCRSAAHQLLDLAPPMQAEQRVCAVLCGIDDVRVADLHLWEIGAGRFGCVATIRTTNPRDVGYYRAQILAAIDLAHLTIEVQRG